MFSKRKKSPLIQQKHYISVSSQKEVQYFTVLQYFTQRNGLVRQPIAKFNNGSTDFAQFDLSS